MSPRYDLIIVGGGILGLSHAFAALSHGLKVALLETSPQASLASARNFGFLTTLYHDGGIWGARAKRSRELYEMWAASGALPLRATGSLQLLQSKAQFTAARLLVASAPAAGISVELLDAVTARTLAPSLSCNEKDEEEGELLGALHFPNDALLEPRAMFSSQWLPAALRKRGGTISMGVSAVKITRSEDNKEVRVLGSDGIQRVANSALLCSGTDTATLLPRVFTSETHKMRLCKLQMMKLKLPHLSPQQQQHCGTPTLPMVLTSGLSFKRYPVLGAIAGASAAATLRANTDIDNNRWAAEEALGIHVIARPAAEMQRNAWGTLTNESGAIGPLSHNEFIVGDSHEYIPLSGGNVFDDVCDEGVTTAILKVAGGMLSGVSDLVKLREGKSIKTGGAQLISQWSGVYLEHQDGLFSATARADSNGIWERSDADDNNNHNNNGNGVIHVVTGIGGKGMTMSPALAEENILKWF